MHATPGRLKNCFTLEESLKTILQGGGEELLAVMLPRVDLLKGRGVEPQRNKIDSQHPEKMEIFPEVREGV